ncbi:MAG: undecaprenyl-diphosphate phosphatase, partial [Verrucomicrobia bacterium]|nr:undecaprenyl-diphosphate phosphatase [Verrucomicrobiota bacterium]
PGASRSGTTILFALLLGTGRAAATEFSFLVGIPTLLAAGAYEGFKALKAGESLAAELKMLLIGGVVATVTAFFVVKWLLRFVQTHTFVAFGWYRVVLGLGMLALAKFGGHA